MLHHTYGEYKEVTKMETGVNYIAAGLPILQIQQVRLCAILKSVQDIGPKVIFRKAGELISGFLCLIHKDWLI